MPSYDNLVVVAAAAAAVPLALGALPRPALPAPVLEIAAGVLLGPVLGWAGVDEAVSVVSTLGLAFLLFLAGSEVDLARLRGEVGRSAATGVVASGLLGLGVGVALAAAGIVRSPGLIAVTLLATSLGLVVPVLLESGAAGDPAGRLVVANASLAEIAAVLLLSLFFSVSSAALGMRALLLGVFVALLAAVALGVRRAGMSPRLTALVDRAADTTAQLRVRLAVLLLVGLSAVAAHLGLEAILGAFVAGVLLRALDPPEESGHPLFRVKLAGIGYGFLVPAFFVAGGLRFDLAALRADPSTLLLVPLLVAALLVVRAAPAALYGHLTGRERLAAGLLQATSLPFLVAASTIGLQLRLVTPATAAALVAAGLVSVLVFPAVAVRLLASAAARATAAPPSGSGGRTA